MSAGTYDVRILWPGWSDVFGDLEQHWEASPLKYVDGTQPPWLVLYGSDDNSGFPEEPLRGLLVVGATTPGTSSAGRLKPGHWPSSILVFLTGGTGSA